MSFADSLGLCGQKPDESPAPVPVPGYKSQPNCINEVLNNTYGKGTDLSARYFTATNYLPYSDGPDEKVVQGSKFALTKGPLLFQGWPIASAAAIAAPVVDALEAFFVIPATYQYLYAYNQCYP